MKKKKSFNTEKFSKNYKKINLIFLIIFIVFILFTIYTYTKGKKVIEISYSKFKSQVKKNNIKQITIKKNKIKGEFKEKYTIKKESKETKEYKHFKTIKPSIEDTKLIGILEEYNVEVNAEESDGSWITTALIYILPWILIIGFFSYMSRKLRQKGDRSMGGGIFGVGKSKAKRITKQSIDTTFDDVAGLKNAKMDLREIVDFLKEPDRFISLGANIPKGILLIGPPGSGKTLMARATAGEADVSFFSISGSEFIEMFVGVGASRVRDLFDTAKKEAPSIIFIDEIDSIGRTRGTGLGGGHDEREQTLNQILAEMDGFIPKQAVVVLAATNRPDVLDPALIRPGRFDRRITLNLPNINAREKILKIHTRNIPLSKNVNLKNIAARTVGFSGADLKNLVNEAALLAGRNEKSKVGKADFEKARDKILLGPKRDDAITEEEKKVIAYHEAGHALVAKLLPNTDPLQKVTIIPRGRSLGVTEQAPEKDKYNYRKEYLKNRLAVMLAGRGAEQIHFSDVSNGAANDLKEATKLARKMICLWGMSEKLGPVYYQQGEEHVFLGKELTQQKTFSDHTAKIIDEEIQYLISEMENKAKDIIKKNKTKLKALADALLKEETLDNKEVEKILKKN